MKGKTDKAVEKIDAILEGYFSSLPPSEREKSALSSMLLRKSMFAPSLGKFELLSFVHRRHPVDVFPAAHPSSP